MPDNYDMFSTDDLFTYNTEPVTVEYIGCGGEFCAGPPVEGFPTDPTDPPMCAACRAGTVNTAIQLRPRGMEG
jgi:hypothetical protein